MNVGWVKLLSVDKIESYAQKITSRGTNDVEKARLIFSWITNRIDVVGPKSARTAAQVLKDWKSSTSTLYCQDYTYLYMALARAAGLRTHMAFVRLNYADRLVSHVCPAVFIGNQAYLVDPAYDWFGVPHKSFEVKDDLGVIGLFMAQLDNRAAEDVGLKLAGNWSPPYFIAFKHRLDRGETNSAFAVLRDVLTLVDTGYYGVYAQALLAEHEERWELAAEQWKKCLELVPELNEAHLGLARALAGQKHFVEAREQWKLYWRGTRSQSWLPKPERQ